MHRYVRLVFGIASPLIGIPANILICIVFARRRPKNAVDIAIMALAVDDLISSSFNALKVLVFFSGVSDAHCVIEMVSLRSGVLAAALLTVTIAIYRFRAIVTPFSRPISPQTATWVSMGCFLLAFTYNSPFIYLSQAHEEGGKMTCMIFGDIGWVGATYAWSQTAVFSLSSLISSMLYFKIFRVIRGQQEVRRKLTAGHVVLKNTQSGIRLVSSSVSDDNKRVTNTVDFPSVEANAEIFNSVKTKDSLDG
ncbi:substance-K receptor-like [Diadema setosum]|uniref:substance-K receptor-like n=1 Tax=Diadema setosum TaxID=31175 RepID=UPI003B3B89F7